MKLKTTVNILSMLLIVLFVSNITAQEKSFQYIGSKKCKMCHSSKKSGGQYKIWMASRHANAFTTLASEESKKIAAKMGITDPQKDIKCTKCHVTGAGEAASMFKKTFKETEGVGCESCHGPGSKYKSMKVMKGITAGTMKGADYGLKVSDEAQCKTCHNENSPTYKPFDMKTFMAKIAHPTPAK